jgi:hypothetical protein
MAIHTTQECVQAGQTNHAFHITYKVKVNFPCACHKGTERSGGIAPWTLNPIMEVSDELHALNALPHATLRLESKLQCFEEDKNHLLLPAIKQFHHHPAHSLATIQNQLSQMCA